MGIHLRVIARAREEATARAMIRPVEDAIHERLGPYVWGYDDETPDQAVGIILMERGLTLATMESCTGGYLGNSITDVADSSRYFKGGRVAYSKESMLAAGVPESVIVDHGLVSPETADAMARAVREEMTADYGIGIAGSAGTGSDRPVGTAYLAIVGPKSSGRWNCESRPAGSPSNAACPIPP